MITITQVVTDGTVRSLLQKLVPLPQKNIIILLVCGGMKENGLEKEWHY